MKIRSATIADSEAIKALYINAFPDEESALVSKLAIELLGEVSAFNIINLVALSQNTIVGHIAYSPVTIENDNEPSAYILAPLAVMPEYQRHGIGTALIEQGMKKLSSRGVNMVFVYGDPTYYSRFGFDVELAQLYMPPYKLQYPAGWQAVALNGCSVEERSVSVICVPPLSNAELW